MSTATPRQFGFFLIAGGIAALANIGSRIAFSHWLAYAVAIVAAYLVGMVVAFILNRLLVFRAPTHALHHQLFWFTAVNIAALLQTLGISLLLARWLLPWLGFHRQVETISHIVGVGVPAITSYIGHRYLSFRTAPGSS